MHKIFQTQHTAVLIFSCQYSISNLEANVKWLSRLFSVAMGLFLLTLNLYWTQRIFVHNCMEGTHLCRIWSCHQITEIHGIYWLNYSYQYLVLQAILSAQKLGLEGEIKIPGYKDCVLLTNSANVTPAQLTRLRRQFITYAKLHTTSDISKIGSLFVQFLNTSLR